MGTFNKGPLRTIQKNDPFDLFGGKREQGERESAAARAQRDSAEAMLQNLYGRLDQPNPFQAQTAGYAQNLAGQANQYLGDIAPVRQELGGILQQVLQGGRPAAMRVFAPEREALEAQFGRAREQAITQTPVRGGQLGQALLGLNQQRALGIGQQEADVRRQALAMSLGYGSNVGPGFAGLQGAGGLFSGLGQQDLSRLLGAGGLLSAQSERGSQALAGKKGSQGALAGSGLGAAASLYGGSSGASSAAPVAAAALI